MSMARPTTDDRTQLLTVSDEILEALRAKDDAAVGACLAADFVHRTEKGALTARAEFLSAVAGAPFVIERLGFETIEADIFGATALVSGVQSGRVRLDDGQVVDTRTAFTDLFVRTSAGWRLQAATSVDLPSEN